MTKVTKKPTTTGKVATKKTVKINPTPEVVLKVSPPIIPSVPSEPEVFRNGEKAILTFDKEMGQRPTGFLSGDVVIILGVGGTNGLYIVGKEVDFGSYKERLSGWAYAEQLEKVGE